MSFEHLKVTGESYFKHMCYALWSTLLMLVAAVTCCIHAFYPDVFQCTASNLCKKVIQHVNARKGEPCGQVRVEEDDETTSLKLD